MDLAVSVITDLEDEYADVEKAADNFGFDIEAGVKDVLLLVETWCAIIRVFNVSKG